MVKAMKAAVFKEKQIIHVEDRPKPIIDS